MEWDASVMEKLDIRTKLWLLLLSLALIFVSPGAPHLLGMTVCVLIAGFSSGVRMSEYMKPCRRLLPLFGIVLLARICIPFGEGVFELHPHPLVERVERASLFVGTWTAVVLASITFLKFISLNEIVRVLETYLGPLQKLGFPVERSITTMVLTVEFVRCFKNDMTRISLRDMLRHNSWEGGLRQRIRLTGDLVVSFFERMLIYTERVDSMNVTGLCDVTSSAGSFSRRDAFAFAISLIGICVFGCSWRMW
jgi:energy-coupling factor transporter transmembrane protein EcfT